MQRNGMLGLRRIPLWLQVSPSILPVLFVFFAMQYSGITVPFWDHTEMIKWIVSWHDGTFTIGSLWEAHNHTRPFVYRAVILANAILTDWDIRSEFVYLYAVLLGTYAAHFLALRKLVPASVANFAFSSALLIVSLFLFSPVGHNNHWWSMMLQLNATNFFVAVGMLTALANPKSWRCQFIAAASCWLAAFTLTNGLFAILAIAGVFQLSASRLFVPSRQTWFWGINLIVLLAVYLPGLAISSGASHPTIIELVQFVLAYLGAPIGGLIWFPFKNMFDIPIPLAMNIFCGSVVVATAGFLCWHSREALQKRDPSTLILWSFCMLAIVSAIATGWGRASFDDYGVSNANSSRYTIFGSYLILGQVYYVATEFTTGRWNTSVRNSLAMLLLTIFVALAGISYIRSAQVYTDAHRFGIALANAYVWGGEPTSYDGHIHPNQDFVSALKFDLQRLEIGPYRSRQYTTENFEVGDFAQPVLLQNGVSVSQEILASRNGLKAVHITIVKPNGRNSLGEFEWRVFNVETGERIAMGRMNVRDVYDWQSVRLRLPYLSDSAGQLYRVEVLGHSESTQAIGVALYLPKSGDKRDQTTAMLSFYGDGYQYTEQSLSLKLDYVN